jgi:hypothetical protein
MACAGLVKPIALEAAVVPELVLPAAFFAQ